MRTYDEAKQLIGILRSDIGPGSTVYVRARIGNQLDTWPATLRRRHRSGRHLVEVTHRSRTYRVLTDSTNVAADPNHLLAKDIAS